MNQVQIFEYNNPTVFLSDYYKLRKSMNTKFSYELWSRELQYSSRSNLRLIVSKKRKVPDSLQKLICQKIFKTVKEKKYFLLICELQKLSKKSKEKTETKANELKNLKYKNIEIEESKIDSAVLSQIYFLVLLGFEDLDKTTKQICKKIGMSENKLDEILNLFEKNGFIYKKGAEWVLNEDYLIFKDNARNRSLAEFHQYAFTKAIAAQNLDPQIRHFESQILPLSKDDYRNYIFELKEFMEEQFIKYNSKKLGDKKIYHFQTGLFPAFDS